MDNDRDGIPKKHPGISVITLGSGIRRIRQEVFYAEYENDP